MCRLCWWYCTVSTLDFTSVVLLLYHEARRGWDGSKNPKKLELLQISHLFSLNLPKITTIGSLHGLNLTQPNCDLRPGFSTFIPISFSSFFRRGWNHVSPNDNWKFYQPWAQKLCGSKRVTAKPGHAEYTRRFGTTPCDTSFKTPHCRKRESEEISTYVLRTYV